MSFSPPISGSAAMPDDRAALRRYARSGDPEAFAVLASRYRSMVLATCRRALGNESDAEDAAQETFLRFAEQAGKIRSDAAACRMRVSRHHAARVARRHRRVRRTPGDQHPPAGPGSRRRPADSVHGQRLRRRERWAPPREPHARLGDRARDLPDTTIFRPSHTILLAETNRMFAQLRVSPPMVANYYADRPGPYAYWHGGKGVYAFQDGHAEVLGFLETGSPDCRWHNGRDLTEDPFVPQAPEELEPHDHPDWALLVPEVYR